MPAFYAFVNRREAEQLGIDFRDAGGPNELAKRLGGRVTAYLLDHGADRPGTAHHERYIELDKNPDYVMLIVSGN